MWDGYKVGIPMMGISNQEDEFECIPRWGDVGMKISPVMGSG